MILDEATSALDEDTEMAVIQGLQELVKAKKELEELGRKRQQLHISFE